MIDVQDDEEIGECPECGVVVCEVCGLCECHGGCDCDDDDGGNHEADQL